MDLFSFYEQDPKKTFEDILNILADGENKDDFNRNIC